MTISFDCYGTLIDWERGILKSLKPVLRKHGIFLDDDEILSIYAEIESDLERVYRPYKEILELVVEEFGRRFGFEPDPYERNVLVDSIVEWEPFEDVRDTLLKIKKSHEIAVISNTDDDIIERSIEKIGVDFDHVITAQRVGSYKPSIEVFKKAMEMMKVSKDEWIHVGQSVYHDIIPARKFGLKTILVLRRGYGATPKVEGKADFVVEDLSGIVSIIEGISS